MKRNTNRPAELARTAVRRFDAMLGANLRRRDDGRKLISALAWSQIAIRLEIAAQKSFPRQATQCRNLAEDARRYATVARCHAMRAGQPA